MKKTVSPTNQFKILVEMMHGLGDTVCALPMLKVLRDNYPDAQIVVLVKSTSGRDIILASQILIDHIIVFDVYKNMMRSMRFLCKLRNNHFDIGISSCITPVKKAQIFMRIVKPEKWVGLQKKGLFFDLLNDQYHFVEANLLSLQECCSIPKKNIYPVIFANQHQSLDYKTAIGFCHNFCKVIGVCIGNADYSLKHKALRCGHVYTRAWGIENTIELIKMLDDGKHKILLMGGKEEEPLLDNIKKEIDICDNIVNFVGKTTIKESMLLAKLCNCIVGVDTGMQHIAAALGTPTVSIFGPTNPRTHGAFSKNSFFVESTYQCKYKYCYGTRNYIHCPNRKCLNSITAAMVVDVINEICNNAGGKRLE